MNAYRIFNPFNFRARGIIVKQMEPLFDIECQYIHFVVVFY